MHTKQGKGLFPTLRYCYRSDGLFGSFHFPVLKMSTFPKITTGQNEKGYYDKTVVLIRP